MIITIIIIIITTIACSGVAIPITHAHEGMTTSQALLTERNNSNSNSTEAQDILEGEIFYIGFYSFFE